MAVILIREEHADYAKGVAERLESELFRVDAMLDAGHMNKKIKEAQRAQTPYMPIAGEREAEEDVAVRRRGTREQVVVPFETFLTMVRELRDTKSSSCPSERLSTGRDSKSGEPPSGSSPLFVLRSVLRGA